jgi:hypothetical protein
MAPTFFQHRVRVRLLVRSAYLRRTIDPISPVRSADPMPRTSRRTRRYSCNSIGSVVRPSSDSFCLSLVGLQVLHCDPWRGRRYVHVVRLRIRYTVLDALDKEVYINVWGLF